MKQLKLFALLASTFSVVFSSSIVLELAQFLNHYVLALIAIFILFVLVMNEYFKVNELYKLFDKQKYSKFIIGLTFVLSFVLSGVGIYFWTNKTQEMDAKNNQVYVDKSLQIEEYYFQQIDSISNTTLSNTAYTSLLENIHFWKNRICRTDDQRMMARENILKLEERKKELENEFVATKNKKIERLKSLQQASLDKIKVSQKNQTELQNKNQFLFYILFSLVAIVELLIIFIQHFITSYFSKEQRDNLKILKNQLRKNNDHIFVDDIRYDPVLNPTHSREHQIRAYAVNFWFLLGNLGIIDKNPDNKGLIIQRSTCYQKLYAYYNELNAKL